MSRRPWTAQRGLSGAAKSSAKSVYGAMSAFVPVIARWEVLVAPDGIGTLPQPDAPVLAALREGAALLDALDTALADPAQTALHLAAPAGPVGAARRADAEVFLAQRITFRRIPVGALPAIDGAEDTAELLQAVINRCRL